MRACKRKLDMVKQGLTRDKLIDLIIKHKLTYDQVGCSYGISKTSVRRLVKSYDIDVAAERAKHLKSVNPSNVDRVLSSVTAGNGKVSKRVPYIGLV